MEISNKKGSRSCETISQLLGDKNKDIDSGGSFQNNVQKEL